MLKMGKKCQLNVKIKSVHSFRIRTRNSCAVPSVETSLQHFQHYEISSIYPIRCIIYAGKYIYGVVSFSASAWSCHQNLLVNKSLLCDSPSTIKLHIVVNWCTVGLLIVMLCVLRGTLCWLNANERRSQSVGIQLSIWRSRNTGYCLPQMRHFLNNFITYCHHICLLSTYTIDRRTFHNTVKRQKRLIRQFKEIRLK